jgi:pimeloyl-ACP methyl ester carboxylesterase
MDQKIRFCTSADGVKLAYAISGAGPPLVMTSTFLTDLEHQCRSLAWLPWLEAFSREHTLVRHDQRGRGLSDRDVGDISFETDRRFNRITCRRRAQARCQVGWRRLGKRSGNVGRGGQRW